MVLDVVAQGHSVAIGVLDVAQQPVRPEETKLLEKINDTIRRLKAEKQFEAWHDKWFGTVLIEGTIAAGAAKRTEELKIAPKTFAVTLVKEAGSKVQLDRLDGFRLIMP